MPFLSALSAVSSALGIISFFRPDPAAADRDEKFRSLTDQLNELEDFVDASQQQILANALGTARTALDTLRAYENEPDAAIRSTLAIQAESQANEGLNQLTTQVGTLLVSAASVETLAYVLYALPVVMSIRTEVSAVVGDGPLGTAGLHAQIKSAADLLYNEANDSNVVTAIGLRLQSDIDVSFTDASVVASAPLSPLVTDTLFGRVTASSEFGGTQERNVGPYIATRLVFTDHPDQSTFDRARDNAEAELWDDNLQNALEAIGYSEIQAFGRAIGEDLAETLADVPNHEQLLSPEDDVADGTVLADYLFGDDGDDELSGLAGPDAVSGGLGNDILRGGQDADYLTGGPGSDMIFGNTTYGDVGAGDTARFEGRARDFAIDGGTTYATVTNSSGERDKLFNIQFLRFDDQTIELQEGSALDGAGDPEGFNVAERVALLYEAALNRDGNIDLPGLNFYIGVTEANNLSDEFLARDLMTSPEFSQNFGNAETLSNEDFLRQVYTNVLERDPDIDGFLFYLNLLNNNIITKELALADIAISPENTAASGDILMSLYESSEGEWGFI